MTVIQMMVKKAKAKVMADKVKAKVMAEKVASQKMGKVAPKAEPLIQKVDPQMATPPLAGLPLVKALLAVANLEIDNSMKNSTICGLGSLI